MNYLLRNNTKKRGMKALMIPLIIVICIGIFHSISPSFFEKLIAFVAYPLWKTEQYTEDVTSNTFLLFHSKKKLHDEIVKLKEEKIRNSIAMQEALLATEENKSLKEILNRSTDRKLTLAAVLKRPPHSPYDTIVIDAGLRNGVSVLDGIYAHGNIPIGIVEEVFDFTSKVKLYSSPGDERAVRVGTSTIEVIAKGKGGGNFEASVPRSVSISIGDVMTVPGIHTIIFGIVGNIDFDPAQSFQKILFTFPFNFSELQWVQIEKKR